MHYHIDMTQPSGEPIGGTGGSKLVTLREKVNCQSKLNDCSLCGGQISIFGTSRVKTHTQILDSLITFATITAPYSHAGL